MSDLVMSQYDTRPYLEATLSDVNGPVDLTTATSVRLVVESSGAVETVNQSSTAPAQLVTILSSTGGQVRYKWQAADLNTPGNYGLEWQVTFTDGTKARFPNSRHLSMTVKPALST